jgi:GNAT superfamily N-acetyltransferase
MVIGAGAFLPANVRYTARAVSAQDRTAWLDMWRSYCDFYEATIPTAVTDATWARILAANSPIFGLVAVNGASGAVAGFANYVVHPGTWSELPVCYLEDLFVRPEARGAGAGSALLRHLIGLGRERHWASVYWMTRAGNHAAQRLYDRFCAHDDFVRYVMPMEAPP